MKKKQEIVVTSQNLDLQKDALNQVKGKTVDLIDNVNSKITETCNSIGKTLGKVKNIQNKSLKYQENVKQILSGPVIDIQKNALKYQENEKELKQMQFETQKELESNRAKNKHEERMDDAFCKTVDIVLQSDELRTDENVGKILDILDDFAKK